MAGISTIPQAIDLMSPTDSLLLPIALAIIMFGIGLNLRFSDFRHVIIAPKAVLFGLLGQMVLLPAIALLIAFIYPMDPLFKLGLVLIAACPGGTASNLVTFILRGRVALSVALTAFNSFLIVLTIPLIVGLGSYLFMGQTKEVSLSAGYVFEEIILTVIVPVLAGMFFNSWVPHYTEKLKKPMRYILPAILLGVFSVVLFGDNGNGASEVLDNFHLLIPVLLLNVLTMVIGYFSSGWVGIRHTGRYTIAIEMGLQNSALAIFLATRILQQDDLALMAVIYGSTSFFVTLGLGYVMQQRGR